MPLLGALLATLFGGVASFLVAIFAKKFAVAAAAVAALAVATVALMAAFRSLVAPLVANAFNTQYGQFIGLAFPPAAGNCLATIALCWSACALYRWQVTAIKLSASA
jgi:hypothetical protein